MPFLRRKQPGTGTPRAPLRVPDMTCWKVLDMQSGCPRTVTNVERRYRQLVARAHPDRGGSTDAMQRLNWARAEARRQLGA